MLFVRSSKTKSTVLFSLLRFRGSSVGAARQSHSDGGCRKPFRMSVLPNLVGALWLAEELFRHRLDNEVTLVVVVAGITSSSSLR